MRRERRQVYTRTKRGQTTMMPVAGNPDAPESVDYKKKYKALKRKLKFLVYEHESFLEELKKAQRKLLKVSRDRSFLLDRLLQYEKVDDSSSDSEATASSDSEAEGPKDGVSTKKRKLSGGSGAAPLPVYNTETPGVLAAVSFSGTLPTQPTQAPAVTTLVSPPPAAAPTAAPPPPPEPSALLKQLSSNPGSAQQTNPKSTPEPPKKRQKVTKKTPKTGGSTTGRPTVAQALQQQQQLQRQQLQRQQLQQQQQQQQLASHISLADAIAPGHMTREELERHLEYKQSTKPQFMSIDKAPNMLPDDIFNDDNSFSDSDAGDRPIKEEEELVIDMQLE